MSELPPEDAQMLNVLSEVTRAIPTIVNIELTNRCNLLCRFCDWSRLSRDMILGAMDSHLLSSILKSIQPHHFYELGLVGLGEPLLDPLLTEHLDIVNAARASFDRITLNTNGIEINANNSALICSSAISHVTISLNAANPGCYLELMGRDAFERVIENTKRFMEVRTFTGRSDLQVDVQIMEGAGNPAVVESLLQKEQDLGLRVFSRKVYAKPSLLDPDCPLQASTPVTTLRPPCGSIFNRVYIDTYGWLYPCTIGNDCYREGSALCLGNVRNIPLMELFNSNAARSARARALSGLLPFPECEPCNIWSLLPNNFVWDDTAQTWASANTAVRLPELSPETKKKGG